MRNIQKQLKLFSKCNIFLLTLLVSKLFRAIFFNLILRSTILNYIYLYCLLKGKNKSGQNIWS